MESLDEYNKRRRAEHAAIQSALSGVRPNGIACPECGKELYDTNPHEVLASLPPQKNVHCECGYSGYRVV